MIDSPTAPTTRQRALITVEETGPLALIEDLGRPGYAHLGVSPSGAADRSALRAANRLVGNPEASAGVEITLGGLTITTDNALWCAVTGPATTVTVAGRPDGSHHPVLLRPGERLTVRAPARGLRNYLAVRGGIDCPAVLGSRSTDLLSKLGPRPLQPGDRLPVGTTAAPMPAVDTFPPPRPAAADGPVELVITPGPRADWFTAAAWRALTDRTWAAAVDSDRTATRLEGIPLERRVTGELPSEGLIRGAVQVPPSGLPLIFGADHPVTGGYPVIAVVTEAGCDRAAQLRPGDRVRLRPSPGTAAPRLP